MCTLEYSLGSPTFPDDMVGSVAVFYAPQARYDTAERFVEFRF